MTGIYFIDENDELTPMAEEPYESEDLLQGLLARHPELLAGDQIDDTSPRRWLLICREQPVPAEAAGGGRWALDHLFVDQDGIPTLVEVKRSSDTRLRREVVGQMLDYAANGIVYWPPDSIRARFESRCASEGTDSGNVLVDALGVPDVDTFWGSVKKNLETGRVRLVFVADAIPAELRRVVEFLNEQMDRTEVLGVEIRQYVGRGARTLVPTVIGQSMRAQAKKQTEGRVWNEDSFMAALKERGDAVGQAVAAAVLRWAREHNLRVWWGRGANYGSMAPVIDEAGRDYAPLLMWAGTKRNYLQAQFGALSRRPPFDDKAKREEFRQHLNMIRGVSIPPDALERYPGIDTGCLANEDARRQLLAALDWVLDVCRGTSPAA